LETEDTGFQDKDTTLEEESKVKDLEQSKEITTTPPKDLPRECRTQRDLSLHNIIGEISK